MKYLVKVLVGLGFSFLFGCACGKFIKDGAGGEDVEMEQFLNNIETRSKYEGKNKY